MITLKRCNHLPLRDLNPRPDLRVANYSRRLEQAEVHSVTRRGYEWLCENTVIMVPDRTYLTTSLDGLVEIVRDAQASGLIVEDNT